MTVENADGVQETVVVTDDHPYWIVGKGWVKSIDLLPGMIALDYDDREIEIISLVDLEVRETTYNIEVEEFHTFFVGELRTWVHNQNKIDPAEAAKELMTPNTTVVVDSIDDARAITEELHNQGVKPAASLNQTPITRLSEGGDGANTYRGDLINAKKPDSTVHGAAESHRHSNPHINVTLENGEESDIQIRNNEKINSQPGPHEPKSKQRLEQEERWRLGHEKRPEGEGGRYTTKEFGGEGCKCK